MVTDKHSQDALAKLYAEWVSAGVKLSVAGFAASTKIMEAATQSVLSARAKANESIRARESQTAAPQPSPVETTASAVIKPIKPSPVTRVKSAPKLKEVAKPTVQSKQPVSRPQEKPGANATVSNDLKLISGIGPKLEQMLNKRGLTTISAIAGLSDEAVAKLDADLGLDGRIARDGWVAQAKKLVGVA
jgi:NADH-quinone oxidoreductase subunit E